MPRLKIPQQLLLLHPNLSKKELRSVIRAILAAKKNKLSKSQVFKIVVPNIGTFRSHSLRKKKGTNKSRTRDRKKKIKKQRIKELDPNNLLF